MEIQVISYRDTISYFQEFFPPAAAEANAFQLARMFDFRSVRPGDYLVLREGGRALFSAELKRGNALRHFQGRLRPALALQPQQVQQRRAEALAQVWQFWREESGEPLILDLVEEWQINLAREEGLGEEQEHRHYRLPLPGQSKPSRATPLVKLPFEERLELLCKREPLLQRGVAPRALYQDYLERGEECERLWLHFEENLLLANLEGGKTLEIFALYASTPEAARELLNGATELARERGARELLVESSSSQVWSLLEEWSGKRELSFFRF